LLFQVLYRQWQKLPWTYNLNVWPTCVEKTWIKKMFYLQSKYVVMHLKICLFLLFYFRLLYLRICFLKKKIKFIMSNDFALMKYGISVIICLISSNNTSFSVINCFEHAEHSIFSTHFNFIMYIWVHHVLRQSFYVAT
jgi:hypothetical protein